MQASLLYITTAIYMIYCSHNIWIRNFICMSNDINDIDCQMDFSETLIYSLHLESLHIELNAIIAIIVL